MKFWFWVHHFWQLRVTPESLVVYRVVFAVVATLHLLDTFPYAMSFYVGPSGLVADLGWVPIPPSYLPLIRGMALFSFLLVGLGIFPSLFLWVALLWHGLAIKMTPYLFWASDYLLFVVNLSLLISFQESVWKTWAERQRQRFVLAPGVRLVQVVILLTYAFSGGAKLFHWEHWASGEAVQNFLGGGLSLANFQPSQETVAVLGVGIISFEILYPILMLSKRWRPVASLSLCLFQGLIAYFSVIRTYSLMLILFQSFFYSCNIFDRASRLLCKFTRARKILARGSV